MITRYEIGVDSSIMNTVYAHQQNSMWCWASGIQMALDVSGLSVSQKEFTRDLCGVDVFGRINNCPASNDEITAYLNGCGWDNYGMQYCVKARLHSIELNATHIIDNLNEGYPIIVAFREPFARYGHVVLISGADVSEDLYTGIITIYRLIVRDPANTIPNRMRKGRYYVSAADFIRKIYSWWTPRVYIMDNRRWRVA